MQKIHFFESFRSKPVKQVSYRPGCSTSGYIACSCVCVGHSGRPRACGPRATLVTYTHAAIRNNHLSRTVRGDNYYMHAVYY